MIATYSTSKPEETIRLGKKLGERLKPGTTVLLFGELGSGKTHFTKGIAEGLGVSELVKSPTFALVHEYELPEDARLHHYDFYRLEEGGDFSEIGLEASLGDPFAINVIEWADRLGTQLPPEYVRVDFKALKKHHEIRIEFFSPIYREEKIQDYYQKWVTPIHVRNHCAQVAKVAVQVGQAYVKKGDFINLSLLETAGKLHDVSRVCDFRVMERKFFTEDITDQKWHKWLDLRRRYADQHHADIGSADFESDGYPELAEIIRLHRATALVEEPESFDTLEKKIVYYADKRVQHTEVVSIAGRFAESRLRYGEFNTPQEDVLYREVEKATLQLEKELFKPLAIQPEDIH